MVHVINETIHQDKNRIWGQFKLSDGSVTKFERAKGDPSWFQWGNITNNLCLTVGRVEQLTNQWAMEKLKKVV